MREVEFHDGADAEMREAAAYYENRRRGLGQDFLDAKAGLAAVCVWRGEARQQPEGVKQYSLGHRPRNRWAETPSPCKGNTKCSVRDGHSGLFCSFRATLTIPTCSWGDAPGYIVRAFQAWRGGPTVRFWSANTYSPFVGKVSACHKRS
jgi:hypothetical protein